jgi:RNA polymerase sigma-70 factor (ECF subfamily)
MVPADASLTTSPAASKGLGELSDWYAQFRDRLRAMIEVRLTPRLAGRLDPSDVVQDAFLEASERYDDYRRNSTLTPYLWLRFLTLQRLQVLYRRHLHTLKRAAGREAVMPELEVSSVVLAQWLADPGTSPSGSAERRELQAQLREALDALTPQDREVLTLRHFEQLNHDEAAEVLGITRAAASRRYYRALDRLREVLAPVFSDVLLG